MLDAYERIRSAILEGVLEPGGRLSQVKIADRLGLSRTPVREALRLIEREGLITSERGRQVVISPTSMADLDELYALRIKLDTMTVRATVPQLSDADLVEMQDCLAAMDANSRQEFFAEFDAAHQQFHMIPIRLAGPRHADYSAGLNEHAERYRRLYLAQRNSFQQSREEHCAIMEACAQRDGEEVAWLLAEVGAEDMSWSAEELDMMAKGNIAHDVFEHVFLKDQSIPDPDTLAAAVPEAYERALIRHAGYLRSPSWEMERKGLEREVMAAALRWRDHLLALKAKIIGNEIWLAGEAHGINLHGKADAILELPDGALLIVDHKKSSTSGRRKRMEAGWDLQAGLYRDMIAQPHRREGGGMDPLIGRKVAVAYHLMNDGGLLTSGLPLTDGSPARDMGDAVNEGAVEKLAERLAELGAGRVVLNTSEDEAFFKKEAGFTPYALTDGSAFVTAFIRQIEKE